MSPTSLKSPPSVCVHWRLTSLHITRLEVAYWTMTDFQISWWTQRNFPPPADECKNSFPESNTYTILHSEARTSEISNNKQNTEEDFKYAAIHKLLEN